MVAYRRVYDKRLKIEVYQEIRPDRCPVGHDAVQRPGWTGCDERGHRIWSCDECHRVTQDADCACGAGVQVDDPECE
jgi:hypothetical protein